MKATLGIEVQILFFNFYRNIHKHNIVSLEDYFHLKTFLVLSHHTAFYPAKGSESKILQLDSPKSEMTVERTVI